MRGSLGSGVRAHVRAVEHENHAVFVVCRAAGARGRATAASSRTRARDAWTRRRRLVPRVAARWGQRATTGVSRSAASACAARAVRRAVRSRHVDPHLHAHMPARSSDEQSVDAALGFEEEARLRKRAICLAPVSNHVPSCSTCVTTGAQRVAQHTLYPAGNVRPTQRASASRACVAPRGSARFALEVERCRTCAKRTPRPSCRRAASGSSGSSLQRARPGLPLTRWRTPLATWA